jgi:nucleoside-diphosphate-sugar epimerase
MRIAILGATSQIARDFTLAAQAVDWDLVLYARRPAVVAAWLTGAGLPGRYPGFDLEGFGPAERFDAVINFIGVGDPAVAASMGASILDVTLAYDMKVLRYLDAHPQCRYLFLSSGAAYGSKFFEPADRATESHIPVNQLRPQDFYGVAKLYAECRHRALPEARIVDIRLFNYFSRTQDLTARFFITDLLRAIKSARTFVTSPENIVRDYIHPSDFHQLVGALLAAEPVNDVVDCFSKAPVDKMTLLGAMNSAYGLDFVVDSEYSAINATGQKRNYFSMNRRASELGYSPSRDSLTTVMEESAAILEGMSLRRPCTDQ